MRESQLENVLERHPDLIEPGLRLIARQQSMRGKRLDLVFRDSSERILVVEIKVGPIGREHIGQLSEYCSYIYEREGVRPRGMLVGTSVSAEIRGAAGFAGFECKCVNLGDIGEKISAYQEDVALFVPSSTCPAEVASRNYASSNIGPTSNFASEGDQQEKNPAKPQSIADMLRSVLSSVVVGTTLQSHEIISMVLKTYPGLVSPSSILVSDKCYNITNGGLQYNHDFRIFEYVGRGAYRYLGEGYPYSGRVTWKDVPCGLWTNGILEKWDNWPFRKVA